MNEINLKGQEEFQSLVKKDSKSKSIFLNKNFMLVIIGEFISLFGTTIFVFAVGWHILSVTKSGVQMGIILMLGIIPNILLSPFMGIIADKKNRRNIMILMNIIGGVIILLLALIIYWGVLKIWSFYITVFLISICSSVFGPAASAIIPNLVETEQLPKANAMNQFVSSFCAIIGLVFGGLFYDSLGLILMVILNAASFFIAAFVEMFIQLKVSIVHKKEKNKHIFSRVIADVREGIEFVKSKNALLFLMIIFSFANLILDPIIAIYIPYTFNVIIKSNSSHLAIVEGALSFGSLLGAIIIPKISTKMLLRTQLLLSMLFSSIVVYGMAVVTLPVCLKSLDIFSITVIFSILSFCNGIAFGLIGIPITVYFCKVIPDHLRGRIFGIIASSVMLAVPIGFFLGGYLVQNVSIYLLVFSSGIFLTLITIIMIKSKSLRLLN